MNFTLADQSIQYTFKAEKYDKGQMQRSLQNVKLDASPESLVKVGQAISKLQGDELAAHQIHEQRGPAGGIPQAVVQQAQHGIGAMQRIPAATALKPATQRFLRFQ